MGYLRVSLICRANLHEVWWCNCVNHILPHNIAPLKPPTQDLLTDHPSLTYLSFMMSLHSDCSNSANKNSCIFPMIMRPEHKDNFKWTAAIYSDGAVMLTLKTKKYKFSKAKHFGSDMLVRATSTLFTNILFRDPILI